MRSASSLHAHVVLAQRHVRRRSARCRRSAPARCVVPAAMRSRSSVQVSSSSCSASARPRQRPPAPAHSSAPATSARGTGAAAIRRRRRGCRRAARRRPKPPSTEPSSREPPRCGAAANTREARRENGRLCSHTVPGPVTLAKNRPSPPNSAVLILPTYWISKLTFGVSATTQPVSTSSVWPGCSSRLHHGAAGVHEGQAVALELLHDEALAAEEADADSFCWRKMPSETPRAAHRKASFWQISVPPSWRRSIGRILPGYGAAKATRCLAARVVGVDGGEQRLAGDQPLAGAEQLAEQAAALAGRAVAEHGVHARCRRP